MNIRFENNVFCVEITQTEFETEKQNVINYFIENGYLSAVKKAVVKYLVLNGIEFDLIILNEL